MKKNSLAKLGIGRDKSTFIIAEAGINHNGDMNIAYCLIDEAKKAGASAIKFQTYITDKRVKKDNPVYGILKQCELTVVQQKRLKAYADKKGVIFFSTPFDEESVEGLQSLGVSLLKVASFDVVNHKLLKKIAAAGLPIIMSRGMATKKELDAAVSILKKARADFALLHCVSAYPTPKEEVNLGAIQTLLNMYDAPIGYSDHTLDIETPVYAVVHGARILEKHFTLDKKMKGPDQALSADPKEFARLVQKVREVERMLGHGRLTMANIEKGTKIFRRPSKI